MKSNGKKIVIVHKKEDEQNNGSTEESEPKTFDSDTTNNESFEELYEKSLTGFTQGEIISGKIASIQHDEVFVDVKYKSEGKINISEFYDPIKVGDMVDVMVIKIEDDDGNLVISKKDADKVISKKLIEKCYKENNFLEGKVINEIKGGLIVDFGGTEAFLPGSHVDVRKANLKDYVGNKYNFKIIKYEPQNNNIILSRKVLLEEEIEVNKSLFFSKVKEGDVFDGKIKSVLDYGAFIELENGIDGFIHIKDICWVHIKNCSEAVSIGDEVKAIVLKLDIEHKKVNLGLKQLTEDPWITFAKKHKLDDALEGTVIKLLDFGAFIKVADGVEGLLHINEISWTKRIKHPKEVLKVGDRVKSLILDIDSENRKLSLSLRQILPNPWDNIKESYPRGKRVTGKISNITNFGVFIELEKDLIGLLRIDDVDWTKKTSSLKQEKRFKKGEKIDVVILDTYEKDKSISLGLKQLLDNPWAVYKANLPKGGITKGEITKVIDSGAFIMLDSKLQGYLPASEMLKKREQDISEIYSTGDIVNVVVTKIDPKKEQILLSVRQHERRLEKILLEKYSHGEIEEKQATLGDLINFKKIKK